MNKIYLLVILLIGISTTTNAQKITGQISLSDKKSVAATTVSLLKSKDSSVVKFNTTKENGLYEFVAAPAGDYLIKATRVGYAPMYSQKFTFNGHDNVQVEALDLVASSGQMEGVTVVSSRPIVEVKADKIVMNVEGTINAAGQDALELLRKSPGVVVDKDDNLSLSGKSGLKVYIDGRPSPLSGTDLSNYLKSLQSNDIESFEIITNPSAKYDAAGNAGIVNIKLRKNKNLGTNGTVTAGWAYGKTPKYNAGLALNNRNAKTNIYGNINFANNRGSNYMNSYRAVTDTVFDQQIKMRNKNQNINYKAGIDYFIDKKNSLGFLVNGTTMKMDMDMDSKMAIVYEPTKNINRILRSDNRNKMDRDNINLNGNYKFSDAKAGKDFSVDLDYGYYDLLNDQYQPNIYYNTAETQVLYSAIYSMYTPSKISIKSIKSDYEQGFKKGKLGFGLKVAGVNTKNDFNRFNINGTQKTLDTLRSNNFDYDENITAGYINYQRPFKNFGLQLGLRAENTVSKGTSLGFRQVGTGYVTYDSLFKKTYLDFFPNIALSFNKNPMNQISLNYSRRIDRPAYQNLNPFEFKLNEYTYQKGNIHLQPQYTNSFGITHSYKYKLNTTLNYSHVKNMFAQLVDTTEGNKSFITSKNLATQDIVSLNISYPFMYKKLTSFFNMNTYYSLYQANFGLGREVNQDVFALTLFNQTSYKITPTLTGEISGFYSSPSVWQGTMKSKAMGGIDIGMQKSIWKGKGNIKASFSDVFHTMKWGGTSDFAGQYSKVNGGWESQQIKLNFTYKFGNAQVKASRQRKTGAEDESKRTGDGGGNSGMGGQ